ncbi:hypothetical protein [Streptomyces phaeofaciens]|nr:hypothetical protein [Streptomyces phaeofaciens]
MGAPPAVPAPPAVAALLVPTAVAAVVKQVPKSTDSDHDAWSPVSRHA